MKLEKRPQGTLAHRVLIILATVLLAVLISWLLGFILRDIDTLPGPKIEEVETRHLDAEVLAQSKDLEDQAREVRKQITTEQQRQARLRESTATSQQTMNQLLEIKKQSLEKGVPTTEADERALDESKTLFLSNQKRYQELNEQVSKLSEQERQLLERKAVLDAQLAQQREAATKEFGQLQQRHSWKVAALKLAFLLPLLLGTVVLFLKKKGTISSPFVHAAGAALLWNVIRVIHQHFPSRYFKYILLIASIGVVAGILAHLLRMMVKPRKDWLLKQYREAYGKFLCPICAFPIRRGPLRYAYWTASSVKRIFGRMPAECDVDEPYTCPSCGTQLFERCASCHSTRYSLLPACDKCGAEKPMEAQTAVTDVRK